MPRGRRSDYVEVFALFIKLMIYEKYIMQNLLKIYKYITKNVFNKFVLFYNRSNHCNLWRLSPDELIRRGEEGNEPGGYFICGGAEKVVRLLVANKRNFPTAMKRRAFREKGKVLL
jgi:DNA-directed RNA polymerase beta subunit